MDLVRQLRRRAVGASLLVPLVLLLAAAAVAASGGGLGGLGSLGQITSGPALPDTGVAGSPAENSGSAEIVGAQLGEPSSTPSTSLPGAGGEALAANGVTGGIPPATFDNGGSGGTVIPVPAPDDVVGLPRPGAPADEPDAPAPPATPEPVNPVGEVIDNTRQLGQSLPGPLGPVVGGILDLLLGPQP